MAAKAKSSTHPGSTQVLLAAALDNMPYGFSFWNEDQTLAICNQRYKQMYAFSDNDVRPGTPLLDLCAVSVELGNHPGLNAQELNDIFQNRFSESAASGQPLTSEKAIKGKLIRTVHIRIPGAGWAVQHEDVTDETERRWMADLKEKAAVKQDARFAAAVNNMPQGLCMFDANERLVVCNRPYALIYSLPPALMQPGTTLTKILEYRFSHGMVPKQGKDAYFHGRKSLIANKSVAKDEIELEDGRTIAIHHHPMPDGGWVATHEDITEQRKIEAKVRHLARHDALTDLPNRVYFRDEMEKLQARIKRNETVAVLCLDLDHFKAVNDTLGHGVGDKVLQEVARRLRDSARETDIVARLGGDEFAFLVPTLEGPRDAAIIAERVIKSIAVPMIVDDHQISALADAGLAANRLELEITESLLLADTELTLHTLYRLRDLGVRISMDDFGTGYSSLSYLRSFPFDKIKIDRSFMDGVGEKAGSLAIIKAVIGLGQSLGMSTTAEGIETEAQLDIVRAQGCNEVQGFLFSPPLPASGLDALLGRIVPSNVSLKRQA